MSLASRTREAAHEQPFLYDALRAGVLNYTAAARYLDVAGLGGGTLALAVERRDGPDTLRLVEAVVAE